VSAQLDTQQGARLLRLARESIVEALGGRPCERPHEEWATIPAATFVTLRHPDGDLQGCIGSLEPRRALADDVASNAVAAALHDPRATPIDLPDVGLLSVEVSLLGPLERIPCHDERSAIRALRPGVDGVVIQWRGARGTLLPQVWENLRDPREFLMHVKAKAHLPLDFWAPDVEVFRYGLQKWTDAPRTRTASMPS
jgi:AmmeMemoRadiSam system protein A